MDADIKSKIAKGTLGGVILSIMLYVVSQSFFYAEPGYIYHVRTVTGNETVVTEIGYKFYPFGRYNAWKRAMTVQAASGAIKHAITAEKDQDSASASLPPMSIVLLKTCYELPYCLLLRKHYKLMPH
ncbi:Putative uncharacterized protein [Moritella viscosa]|uniref:hypothetical protein n=1 Tax=Moritella viscosa TaxID=80854 RepID=UPI00090F1BE4|nr:hypothetical protein [Moritella viscosa]SHO01462.1 Putative uncharacterized protein [Moritella viscosa]SHO20508.1 Putative uncharacterized protein [Moritella viscosa]